MYNQLKREPGFPVTEYGGHKWILISTRTVVGGKNPFMGIAYVVVGGTCVLLGALFTIAHLIRPRYAFCLFSLLLSWFFLSFLLSFLFFSFLFFFSLASSSQGCR